MALNPENRIPTTAGTNEIFFNRNTGKISYKNNLGIVTLLEGSNISNISQSAEDGLNFNFKEGSIGPKVSFTKVSGSDPSTNQDVIIPGQLEITRGNSGGGIYNVAVESNYSNSSPQYTGWNTQYVSDTDTSWAFLHDIEARSYTTWKNAIETPAGNGAAPQYVGMPAVMYYDNGVDKRRYWLILFTEWGVGGNNEYGFAYERYEIYPEVLFDRPNYSPSTLDILSAGVHIARKDNGGQLYNILSETNANQGVSPEKTKWNSIYTDGRTEYSGFSNLNNLESRVYTDFSAALDNNVGNNILTTELIMWDLTTDLYYKVVFISWQSGGLGGGFSYRRTVIPQSCGIKFADGTVLNTAKGLGSTGVQSVTGLSTDNTDPLNPVVQISVDGTTVTGDGTLGNPLVAAGSSLPAWVETDATDKTIWCNGNGDIFQNCGFGESTLQSATSSGNTAFGTSALSSTTSGGNNSAFGTAALANSTGALGFENSAFGRSALQNATSGFSNSAFGNSALEQLTTGTNNVAVGSSSLYLTTIGANNTAIGESSMRQNTTGGDNVAVGSEALYNNTLGSQNTAFGTAALPSLTTGTNNVAVGYLAGGFNLTTGSDNVIIGPSAGMTGNYTGSIVLGNSAQATGNNQFVVGSTTVNAGTVTNAAAAQSHYWTVKINGIDYKILLSL